MIIPLIWPRYFSHVIKKKGVIVTWTPSLGSVTTTKKNKFKLKLHEILLNDDSNTKLDQTDNYQFFGFRLPIFIQVLVEKK